MPLPVLAFFPWLVGLFTSTMGALFTWFVAQFALRTAYRFALTTAYVLAIAAITVAVAVLIKALILGIRVTMPIGLGDCTYFLPNNINVIIGAYFSMRISYYLYRWSANVLTAYVRFTGA